jgi:hypothetical protein
MVICDVSQWTIEVITQHPATNSPRGDVLVFDIENVTGINISGKVHLQTGGFISDFTGTCRAVQRQHLNIMTFEFAWGAANVILAGTAFAVPNEPNRFIGRFRAIARAVDAVERDSVALLAGPPDPGDTGTGNGTQT